MAIYLGQASFHDACHGNAFVNGVFRLSWSVSNGQCGWKDNWKRPFEVDNAFSNTDTIVCAVAKQGVTTLG